MALLKASALVCASFMLTPLAAIPYDQPQTEYAPQFSPTVKPFRGSVIYKTANEFPDFMFKSAENASSSDIDSMKTSRTIAAL
jgi:hypothetical protein